MGILELYLLDTDLASHVGPGSRADLLDGVLAILRSACEKNEITGAGVYQQSKILLLNLQFDQRVAGTSFVRDRGQ